MAPLRNTQHAPLQVLPGHWCRDKDATLEAAALSSFLLCVSGKDVVLPPISSSPKNASQTLDPRLASFSIEFSYLPSFGGNLSHPNILSRELLKRLEERTGLGRDIRPGGITADSSIFDPNGPALVLAENALAEYIELLKPKSGPAYYESLAVFPKTSRVIVDVNLGNNSIDIANAEAQAAIKILGMDRIYAFELGNEPDQCGSSRPANWSSTDYTNQFLNWTATLTQELSLPPRIFQAGSFAMDPTSTAKMTTVSIINEGIDATGVIKLFIQHTYQYSTCDPVRNAKATLPNLINHRNITIYGNHKSLPQKAQGKSSLWESIILSGKQNVTDTFGQALWIADTVLYGAFLNISRLYLHQCATLVLQSSNQANAPGFSWYDLWYPVATDRYGALRASPSFVAYLLVTEAVGRSQQSQLSLIEITASPQLAAYAIWDPAVRAHGLARLVLLNLGVRNSTASAADKAAVAVTVDISPYFRRGSARLKRMTSPGLESKDVDTVTWAGQSYAHGTPSGVLKIEHVVDGLVTVQGSEAVLISFA